jgi:hypothetical protein
MKNISCFELPGPALLCSEYQLRSQKEWAHCLAWLFFFQKEEPSLHLSGKLHLLTISNGKNKNKKLCEAFFFFKSFTAITKS